MRILYVAGFFAPVLEKLRAAAEPHLHERSMIWIPQRTDRQLDITALKSNLLSEVSKGAAEVLVCAFAFRGHDHVFTTLDGIAAAAERRYPGVKVRIQRFKNAADSDGLLAALQEFAPTRTPRYPESIIEVESWFRVRAEGRLLLHPRALRGAKQSIYRDVNLVYAALTLLANEYWEMRTAKPPSAARCSGAFTNKLLSLNLEIAPSISESRAGEQGEDYRVLYPIGAVSKRMLDFHLKAGTDRDQRNCLRIYFFWDEGLNLVVVGWLTSHLDTRAS